VTDFTEGNIVTTEQASPFDLIERNPTNGALIDDVGYPSTSGRGKLLAQRPGDSAIYYTWSISGGGDLRVVEAIGLDRSDLGIYLDPAAEESANGLTAATRYGLRFDASGRLYLLYRQASNLQILRYAADGSFDAFFDMGFTLSPDSIVDEPPEPAPNTTAGAFTYRPSGVDIDSTGQYVYATSRKGSHNDSNLYTRSIYRFDLTAGPSASLWKQYPWYSSAASLPPNPSPDHGVISYAMALAVDPTTGNVAVYELERSATFITVGTSTGERDHFDFFLRVYDPSGVQVSSVTVASTEEPLNIGGFPSGDHAPQYQPGAGSVAAPMCWARDGSNVWYWVCLSIGTDIYLADQSGIISPNLIGTGQQRTFSLTPYSSGAPPTFPGLSRFNAASAAQEYWQRV
jgi:hypothetical protein